MIPDAWIDTLPKAAALGYFAFHVGANTLGSVASLVRRWWPRPHAPLTGEGISVLIPLAGADAELEANLESHFTHAEGRPTQVVFIANAEADAALPIARAVAARHGESATIVVGGTTSLVNPKVKSLHRGAAQARHPLLWCIDSNVRMTADHRKAMLDALAVVRTDRPALVHAPLSATSGSALGASMERLHFSTYYNWSYELAALTGQAMVFSKSLLVHRDDLAAIGGFERFGNDMHEDYAMSAAMHRVGRIGYARTASRQVLGRYTLRQFFARQRRWAIGGSRIFGWQFYLLAQWSYFAPNIVLAFFGLLPWTLVGSALAVRAALDVALHRVHALTWPRALDVALLPLKELVVFAAYLSAWPARVVVWRGKKFELRAHGKIVALDEPKD